MVRPARIHPLSFVLLSFVLPGGLAACAPVAEAPPDTSFHAATVEVRHGVLLATGAPAAGEVPALTAFLAETAAPGRTVRVEAAGPAATASQAAVLDAVRHAGFAAAPGSLYGGAVDQATIVVARMGYVSNACAVGGAPMLDGLRPPGCSNALDLAAMVERPDDLVTGRTPGPAPAGPVGRAALRYLKSGGEATLSETPAASAEAPSSSVGASSTTAPTAH